jgi:hypothetical protein
MAIHIKTVEDLTKALALFDPQTPIISVFEGIFGPITVYRSDPQSWYGKHLPGPVAHCVLEPENLTYESDTSDGFIPIDDPDAATVKAPGTSP